MCQNNITHKFVCFFCGQQFVVVDLVSNCVGWYGSVESKWGEFVIVLTQFHFTKPKPFNKIPGTLSLTAHNSTLFPPYQLRMDVVWRLLFAHRPRICLHIREKISQVVNCDRLGNASCHDQYLRYSETLLRQHWGHTSVSKNFGGLFYML